MTKVNTEIKAKNTRFSRRSGTVRVKLRRRRKIISTFFHLNRQFGPKQRLFYKKKWKSEIYFGVSLTLCIPYPGIPVLWYFAAATELRSLNIGPGN